MDQIRALSKDKNAKNTGKSDKILLWNVNKHLKVNIDKSDQTPKWW